MALGLAPPQPHWNLAAPATAAAAAARYKPGQLVQAVVEKAAKGEAKGDGLRLRLVDDDGGAAAAALVAAQAAPKRAGLAPLRGKADARPGVHALARATALSATHLSVHPTPDTTKYRRTEARATRSTEPAAWTVVLTLRTASTMCGRSEEAQRRARCGLTAHIPSQPTPPYRRSLLAHASTLLAHASTPTLCDRQVLLDKKNAVRGCVHLSEMAEPGEAAKMPLALPQGPLHVVVLGGGEGKNSKVARTCTQPCVL